MIRAIRTTDLLLGMKGTMSEMELSILRQRSLEALRQKARRGELFLTVAVGYVRSVTTGSERTPIGACAKLLRWCSPSSLRCKRFVRCICGCGRSACLCPRCAIRAEDGRGIVWKLPVYNTIHAHPDEPDLRWRLCLRAHRQPGEHRTAVASGSSAATDESAADWEVLIPNHHEGYSQLDGVREEPTA